MFLPSNVAVEARELTGQGIFCPLDVIWMSGRNLNPQRLIRMKTLQHYWVAT